MQTAECVRSTEAIPTAELAQASPKAELARSIKAQARELGFDQVGIAPAVVGLGQEPLDRWLAAGRHGQMNYMAQHRAARLDPNLVLQGVRSVVVVALGYRGEEPAPASSGFGRLSRYAWGSDYHDVLRDRLEALRDRIGQLDPSVRTRAVVDSAPLMERDYARLAGLGWFGKNTLLLDRQRGSWSFLGAVLVDRELEYDAPFEADHCGTCTRCLDACPTQAFLGPYELDARRCISYLTIEHRSAIPAELRPGLGEWVFGCDVCQDVCPWTTRSPAAAASPERSRAAAASPETEEPAEIAPAVEFGPRPDMNPIPLGLLLRMSESEFRTRFRGTPLFRTRWQRLLRNAAIVAGNQRCQELRPDLQRLADHPDPVVQEAAQWALARLDAVAPCGPTTVRGQSRR